MAKHRCPYTYPHRSRAGMTAYIVDRTAHSDYHTTYPICWNVKVYSADWSGHAGDETVNARFDKAWDEYMNDNPEFSSMIFEDAGRTFSEGEYTTYPGDDQGDWRFGFFGRSGGWLALTEWTGTKLYGRDFDLAEFCAALSFTELRILYRALRCMDADITRDKVNEEVSFHVNFQRHQWEADRLAEEDENARDAEANRPDMYETRGTPAAEL